MANLYLGTNLGRTGQNAPAAGFSSYPYGKATVADYGANLINSAITGGYYNSTDGNFTVTPEVQHSSAKKDAKADLFQVLRRAHGAGHRRLCLRRHALFATFALEGGVVF